MSDYLWDGSGAPDLEIAALESRLAPLRLKARWDPERLEQRVGRKPAYGAIAASLAIGALAFGLLSAPAAPATEWAVTGLEGDVRVGRTNASLADKLRAGQPLVTGRAARVSLENEDFGQLNLAPESVLRVIESKDGRDVMSLQRGRLHAFIWAPPRQFVVDTPSSRAVDLGCEYTLTVDPHGNGFVEVDLGWVAFQFGAQESFIPAGAACRTIRRSGPGVPFYRDAPKLFVDALERYESHADPAALQAVLQSAREQDALTLWHLLTRVPATDRAAVYDRFASLARLPEAVSRQKALDKDGPTLDLCWNALGLDDAGWWREWKREWKPR